MTGNSMQPCLAGLCSVTDLCCAVGLCFSTGSCFVTSPGPLRSRSCGLCSNLVKFDAGPQETQRHPMHFTELQMGVGIGSGTHRQMWTATTNFNPTNQDHCKKRISYETHATTIFPIVQAQRSLKLRLQQPKPSQAQRQCC